MWSFYSRASEIVIYATFLLLFSVETEEARKMRDILYRRQKTYKALPKQFVEFLQNPCAHRKRFRDRLCTCAMHFQRFCQWARTHKKVRS